MKCALDHNCGSRAFILLLTSFDLLRHRTSMAVARSLVLKAVGGQMIRCPTQCLQIVSHGNPYIERNQVLQGLCGLFPHPQHAQNTARLLWLANVSPGVVSLGAQSNSEQFLTAVLLIVNMLLSLGKGNPQHKFHKGMIDRQPMVHMMRQRQTKLIVTLRCLSVRTSFIVQE